MSRANEVLEAIKRYKMIFQEPVTVTGAIYHKSGGQEPSQIDLDIGPHQEMKQVLERLEIMLPNHQREGNLLVSETHPTVRVYRET